MLHHAGTTAHRYVRDHSPGYKVPHPKRQKSSEHVQLQSCYPFFLTLWRRNYFFLILAHPVYKM